MYNFAEFAMWLILKLWDKIINKQFSPRSIFFTAADVKLKFSRKIEKTVKSALQLYPM